MNRVRAVQAPLDEQAERRDLDLEDGRWEIDFRSCLQR